MKLRENQYQGPEISEQLIPSKYVAQTFKISVFEPMRHLANAARFPVLYATDSDDFFGGLATITAILQLLGETERFILVGIGYGDARAARLLRWRDFFPHAHRTLFQTLIGQTAELPFIGGVDDLDTITRTSDASHFLQFIREELIPFITSRYPALPDANGYFGYSAGGGFGVYALLSQPDTFGRYILGSPTTSFAGENFGIQLARAFIKTGRQMNAKVFMSVGELEEFGMFGELDLVTGSYLLAKFLKNSRIPGLDLQTRLFPGETHATGWTLAFSHGVKTLFEPAEQRPQWLERIGEVSR